MWLNVKFIKDVLMTYIFFPPFFVMSHSSPFMNGDLIKQTIFHFQPFTSRVRLNIFFNV